MSDPTTDPNVEQITVWRNLLDAFAELSAAWDAAAKAQQAAEPGEGPTGLAMPQSLVASFGRAGQEGADALAGLATVLAQQGGDTAAFGDVADAQRTARDQWSTARQQLGTPDQSRSTESDES